MNILLTEAPISTEPRNLELTRKIAPQRNIKTPKIHKTH
jgi:hypothetical protein